MLRLPLLLLTKSAFEKVWVVQLLVHTERLIFDTGRAVYWQRPIPERYRSLCTSHWEPILFTPTPILPEKIWVMRAIAIFASSVVWLESLMVEAFT